MKLVKSKQPKSELDSDGWTKWDYGAWEKQILGCSAEISIRDTAVGPEWTWAVRSSQTGASALPDATGTLWGIDVESSLRLAKVYCTLAAEQYEKAASGWPSLT